MWYRGKRRKTQITYVVETPQNCKTASRAESPSEEIFDKFNHKK